MKQKGGARLPWRNLALGCALLCVLLSLTACRRGLNDKTWAQVVDGARSVAAALAAGDYATAQKTFKPVDNVIHASYPELEKIDPKLAGKIWYDMALVELGFLHRDWEQAKQGIASLPDALAQARKLWGSAQ